MTARDCRIMGVPTLNGFFHVENRGSHLLVLLQVATNDACHSLLAVRQVRFAPTWVQREVHQREQHLRRCGSLLSYVPLFARKVRWITLVAASFEA